MCYRMLQLQEVSLSIRVQKNSIFCTSYTRSFNMNLDHLSVENLSWKDCISSGKVVGDPNSHQLRYKTCVVLGWLRLRLA
ncbi:unnamed protein product [Lactuca virosa]|uniref:Uncharacterized protein n=1 Tax=Lactuca virosa TaxID=75947 RepID=A0AAU9NWP1_9ASTR|nr:unnamed protein product [Lactuca virosa]